MKSIRVRDGLGIWNLAFLLLLSLPHTAWTDTYCQMALPLSCVGINHWGPRVNDNFNNAGSNPAVCMQRAAAYYKACGLTPDSGKVVTANYYSDHSIVQTGTYPPLPLSSSASLLSTPTVVACSNHKGAWCAAFADASGIVRQVYLSDNLPTVNGSGLMGTQAVEGHGDKLAYLYTTTLLTPPVTGYIDKGVSQNINHYVTVWILDLTTSKLVGWLDTKYLAKLSYDPNGIYFDIVHNPEGQSFPFLAPGIHYLRVPYWHYLCIFDSSYISHPSSACGRGFKPYSVDFTPLHGVLSSYVRHNGGWVQDVNGDGWDDIHLPFLGGYILTLDGKTGQQLGLSHFDAADISNITFSDPPGMGGYYHSGRFYGGFTSFVNPQNGKLATVIASANPVGGFTDMNCNVSRFFAVVQWQDSQWQPLWSSYLSFDKTVFRGPFSQPYAGPSTPYWRLGDDLNKCAHRFSDSLTWVSGMPYVIYNLFNEQSPAPLCQEQLYQEQVSMNHGISAYLAHDPYYYCSLNIVNQPGTWSVHIVNALNGQEVANYPGMYLWGRAQNILPHGGPAFLVQRFTSNDGVVPFKQTGTNIDAFALATLQYNGSAVQLNLLSTLPHPPAPPVIAEYPSPLPLPLPKGEGASHNGIPEFATRQNSDGSNDILLSNNQWLGWSTDSLILKQ